MLVWCARFVAPSMPQAGVLHGHQAYGTAFGEEYGSADRVYLCCQVTNLNYFREESAVVYSGVAWFPRPAVGYLGVENGTKITPPAKRPI